MEKIWKPKESKSDKLILIHKQSIYKGNPSKEQIDKLNLETQNLEVLEKLFSIPYSYIKKIVNQESINHIKIFFGNDSEEELKISNERLKNEVFNYLKNDITSLTYRLETPSSFKYAKAQFFGIIISSGLFIWAMYFAIQMSNGYEYEIVGGRPGITGIVLALANFGITKLVIGYSAILGIALFSLIKKLKTRTEMQILER